MKKKKKQFEDYFQEATDVSGEQEQVVGKTFEEYLGMINEFNTPHSATFKPPHSMGNKKTDGNLKVNPNVMIEGNPPIPRSQVGTQKLKDMKVGEEQVFTVRIGGNEKVVTVKKEEEDKYSYVIGKKK